MACASSQWCAQRPRAAPSLSGAGDAKHKRMRVMMVNAEIYSDVEFRIGAEGRPVLGLKALFARASEVFAKMFYGGFREQANSAPVVVVSDIEPAPFEQLRRWVYDTDIILSHEVVFGVLDAARKYMMEELEVCCRKWLAVEASCVDGAVRLWVAAAAGGWQAWADALLERVERFGPAVVLSPALELLPLEAVAALTRRPDFCPPEEAVLFDSLRAWVRAAPRRGESSDAAWQSLLDQDLVRFELMDMKSFVGGVVDAGLLPQERSLSVIREIVRREDPCSSRRRQLSLLSRLREILHCSQAAAGAGALRSPRRRAPNADSNTPVMLEDLPAASHSDSAWCQVKVQASADDVEPSTLVESLVELSQEDGFSTVLAQALVEQALMHPDRIHEMVSTWSELWGALGRSSRRDECVKAVVNRCQALFESEPDSDASICVWRCPVETLGLVRILCWLTELRKLAVSPLMKVLPVLVQRAEEGMYASCAPVEAARELLGYLVEISGRKGHLSALGGLPELRSRLAKVSPHVSDPRESA